VLFPCGAQALFSNSKALGGYMGDTEHRATAAITLAVLGFGLTDVSLNVLQVWVRALVNGCRNYVPDRVTPS
jgi:histidine ammonia-lyase